MNLPAFVVLFDSLGDIHPDNTSPILVCASHCGDNGTFAGKLRSCNVEAVFLNNAGIIACTVDCMSAEIFNGQDTLENGIITVCNQLAKAKNIKEKMSVRDAIKLI